MGPGIANFAPMAELTPAQLERYPGEVARKRLLAHGNVFTSVYARNCELRRIDQAQADAFFGSYHDLGATRCRYRYGLFIARTGHCPRPGEPWLRRQASPHRAAGTRGVLPYSLMNG